MLGSFLASTPWSPGPSLLPWEPSALLCGRWVVKGCQKARVPAPRDQDGRVQAKDSMWLAGANAVPWFRASQRVLNSPGSDPVH